MTERNAKIPRASTTPPDIPIVNLYSESEDRREMAAFYGGTLWKRLRLWHLAQHPTCAKCGMIGNTVDHIVPRRQLEGLEQYNQHNLQTLCRGCHGAKRKEEGRRY